MLETVASDMTRRTLRRIQARTHDIPALRRYRTGSHGTMARARATPDRARRPDALTCGAVPRIEHAFRRVRRSTSTGAITQATPDAPEGLYHLRRCTGNDHQT